MLVQLNGIIPQPRLEVINSELMRDIGDDLSQFGGQRNLPFTKRLLFAESCLQLVRRIYAGLDTYERREGRWVRTVNASTFEEAYT